MNEEKTKERTIDCPHCGKDVKHEQISLKYVLGLQSELTRLREENELMEKEVVRLKKEYSRECCEHQDCIMDRDKYKRALDGVREENEKMWESLIRLNPHRLRNLWDDLRFLGLYIIGIIILVELVIIIDKLL